VVKDTARRRLPLTAGGEQPYVDTGPGAGPPDALVLDIGEDIGALLLYSDESLLGTEIDITPLGAPRSHHVHTMIRRRRIVGHDVIVGVYPQLTAGYYTIWANHGVSLTEVEIVGGQVSEVRIGEAKFESERMSL
jgi:hypothetical protein